MARKTLAVLVPANESASALELDPPLEPSVSRGPRSRRAAAIIRVDKASTNCLVAVLVACQFSQVLPSIWGDDPDEDDVTKPLFKPPKALLDAVLKLGCG
jgi:hypothetical protein